MNFEQWFNSTPYEKYHKGRHISEKTWDACKTEVLKILNSYGNHCQPLDFGPDDADTREDEYISLDVIKEIERL